jgi:hypothetical protein
MNYELAKKLKEAGFPLKGASLADHNNHVPYFTCGLDSIGRIGNWLYPTLSELIEACKVSSSYFRLRIQYNGCVIELPNHWDLQIKDTPEEAVAELWLVLNKK